MVFAIHQLKLATGIHICVPSLLNPPHSPPDPSCPGLLLWVPCIIHQTPTAYLFYIW